MESNQIILPNETIQIETENLKIAPQFTVDNVKKAIVANQMGTLISARKKKYTFVGIKTSPCKYFPEKGRPYYWSNHCQKHGILYVEYWRSK